MRQKFHQRFNIDVSIEEARSSFVARAYNAVYTDFFLQSVTGGERHQISKVVLTHLGIKADRDPLFYQQVGKDFFQNVRTLEVLYQCLSSARGRQKLENIIRDLLSLSEVDLEIRWENGEFLPSGAPLLDEKLVNDTLGWLRADKSVCGVLKPFDKALGIFVHSMNKPELLSDVITNTYEAVEALSKIITGHDRGLSSNQEGFISKIKASAHYKPILKEYIAYANAISRHAGEKGQPKNIPSRNEVESFMYLTGLFLRMAMIGDLRE